MCKVCKRNLSPILFKTTNAAALFPRSLHFIKTTEMEKVLKLQNNLLWNFHQNPTTFWIELLDRNCSHDITNKQIVLLIICCQVFMHSTNITFRDLNISLFQLSYKSWNIIVHPRFSRYWSITSPLRYLRRRTKKRSLYHFNQLPSYFP